MRVLYCHCAFSRVVPDEIKSEVLTGLADSPMAFDAVPDLCELAARQDPSLERLAAGAGDGGSEDVHIVACYPRAVRWLFHAAESPLPEDGVTIHNMRAQSAPEILESLGLPSVTPDAEDTDEAQDDEAQDTDKEGAA